MIITNQLKIDQPPDLLYGSLIDLDRVAPCIPGATLGAESPDGSRAATIEVAFGPMRFQYEGTVRIAEQDAAARSAVMLADARETSGEGNASARIGMSVAPAGATSLLSIETDLRVSGGIAQIGAGMIEEVGQELLEEFGTALGARDLAAAAAAGAAPTPPPTAVAPLKGHRLVFRALMRRLRRFFGGGSQNRNR
jgi:hypothetical protein